MSIFNKLTEKLTEYLRLKGEKLKLEIISQVARLLAYFAIIMLIGLISLFLFVFLSLAASAYINLLLDSSYLGHLILAGFYLLCLFVLMLFLKSNKLQIWLEALFIRFGEGGNESENLNDDTDE